MKPFSEMEFHPQAEELVKILCAKTQNTNPLFFRVMVAYYFSVVASMMRCKIDTLDRGEIPVNLYAINLSTSGSGKGFSTNVLEEQVIDQFRHNFTENTFPLLADANLPKIAQRRAIRLSTDPDDELKAAQKEFEAQGPLVFSFDSGTAPAVKQARHKLLMANAGSMNLQIDEIGSNLLGNMEVLNTFLELYDVGRIKQKLVKNTNENTRHEEIQGRTPTNMMLFGTPSRLLNGSKVEDEFYSMLDTGYARRCFFGYVKNHERDLSMTPEEVLAQRTDTTTDAFLESLSDHLGDLADMMHVDKKLQVTKEVTLLFIEYQIQCECAAEELADHEEMRKAELGHRYFKALKLAGAYAFIDNSPELTEDHAYFAIKLAEQSGEAFQELLTRDRPYVKLAQYIAAIDRPVTQADLVEDLPIYKGNTAQKQEMMALAIAHGYKNNIVIKKEYVDGIEFLKGETLKATDITKMRVSYSDDIAYGYCDDVAHFNDLHKLTQATGKHWCTHYFKDGHRTDDAAIPGFNLVVLDVDHGINIGTAQKLLQDYRALFYTTKRHTDDDHRFRIILPTNYLLELDSKEYKEFMASLYQWLPFEVDTATGQRNRKWLSHNGNYAYQEGELLDVLPFIPKTTKNENMQKKFQDQQSLDNLERWVVNNTGDGNRNNMLLKYAMILVDAGFDFEPIRQRTTDLNDKLADKLPEAELMGTVMLTVGKALASR